MNHTINNLLAAGGDMIESLVVVAIIGMSVLGNIAKAWIKRVKEKKERQQQAGHLAPPPTARPRTPAHGAFPAAAPRQLHRAGGQQPRTHPQAPVAQPVRPAPPQRPAPRPQAPAGIPRELLPEGLEEVLGEILPKFLQPKKPVEPQHQAPPHRRHRQPADTHTARQAPPEVARKPQVKKATLADSDHGVAESAKRLGRLQSSFEKRESTVASHVSKHISHLKHPVPDATIGSAAHAKKLPTRAELRRAIIMNEVLSKPRALRPLEDLF